MVMSLEEKRSRDCERHRLKNHADAIAAGRVPGILGKPRVLTDEEREASRIKQNKRRTVNTLKRRTAKRAAKALEEGRTPGKSGKKRTLVTPEMVRQAQCRANAKFRAANIVEIRARDAAKSGERWNKLRTEHPERYRIMVAANGAKQRLNKCGTATPKGLTAIVRRVWERSGGKCAVCPSSHRLELDHIVAVANGGDNAETNLQFLCETCNRSKSAKDFTVWLASRAPVEGIAA